MRLSFWGVLAAACAIAYPVFAEAVPTSVYDCYGPSMALGRSPDIREGAGRGSVLNTSGGKFSVVGASEYMSRRGATGHFKFDGLTLSMIDGPYAGIQYHKVPSYWTFRMLRENGEEGPIMCPRNDAKDPRKPNGW